MKHTFRHALIFFMLALMLIVEAKPPSLKKVADEDEGSSHKD